MVDSRHDRFDLQVQGTPDRIRDHLGCVEEMTVHPGITQRLASGSKHDCIMGKGVDHLRQSVREMLSS